MNYGQKVTLDLRYIDEHGNEYEVNSTFKIYSEGTILEELGKRFNILIKSAGYPREHDYLFMTDVTEEEYDLLDTTLWKHREAEDPIV